MILVTGATGNAGGGVVNGLLELGAPTRALVRTNGPRGLPDAVETVVGDLNDPSSVAGALDGVKAVFLLAGYAGIEETLAEMKRAGVERVVLLSGSGAASGDRENAIAAYQIRSERAVRDSGIAWTFLQPNSFMANALRWLPQLANGGDLVKAPFADVPVAMIHNDDLGAVAAAALTSTDHEGRTYRLSGPEALRPAEQVEIVSEAIGRLLRFQALSNDEARKEMEGQMPREYVDAFFGFFVDGIVDETTVQPTVKAVLGREPKSFREWALENADRFR